MYFLLVIAFLAWSIYLHFQIRSKVDKEVQTERDHQINERLTVQRSLITAELKSMLNRVKENSKRINRL